MTFKDPELTDITQRTVAHYEAEAMQFWEGCRFSLFIRTDSGPFSQLMDRNDQAASRHS